MTISQVASFLGSTSSVTLSGVTAGDLLVGSFFSNGTTAPTPPSGWTTLFQQPTTSGNANLLVAYKSAVGGETTTTYTASVTAVVQQFRAAAGKTAGIKQYIVNAPATGKTTANFLALSPVAEVPSILAAVMQAPGQTAASMNSTPSSADGITVFSAAKTGAAYGTYYSGQANYFTGATKPISTSTAYVTAIIEIAEFTPSSATLSVTEQNDTLAAQTQGAVSAHLGEGGGTSSRPWTPADLGAKLKFWVDAQDSASITQSGGAVSAWADKAPSGTTLTQATGSAQPTYQATGFNGKPTLSFDGNDFLRGAKAIVGGAYPAAFLAANLASTSTANATFLELTNVADGYKPDATNAFAMKMRGVGTGAISFREPMGIVHRSAFSFGAPHVFGHWDDGSTGRTRADGADGADTYATGLSHSSDSITLGYSQFDNIYSTIAVSEVVVTGGAALTTSEIELIEGYMAWRWGLQANLPSGHTYKAAAPTVTTGSDPSLQEANDTLSATASILLNATLAAQMEQDTLAATAQLRLGAALGLTEQNDTLAATGQLAIQATLARTDANDTLSASGKLDVRATGNAIEGDDTLAATALIQTADVNASLARTEADDALTASSKLEIRAIGDCYEADDTLVASVFEGNSASFAGVEQPDTCAGLGKLDIAARGAATEANDTLTATTHIETLLYAALNKAEADDKLTSQSVLLIKATAAITEVNDTLLSRINLGVIWDGEGDGGGVTFVVPASGSEFTVPSATSGFVVPAVDARFEVPAAPSFVFPR